MKDWEEEDVWDSTESKIEWKEQDKSIAYRRITKTTRTMTRTSLFALAVSLLSASTHAFAPTPLRPTTALVATTTANTALGMFTGIVEEMGTVVDIRDRNDMTLWDGSIGMGTELTVRGDVVMDGAYLGYVYSIVGVMMLKVMHSLRRQLFFVPLIFAYCI